MIGLNADPAWRCACVARSKLLRLKSRPPTSARTSPFAASIETRLPCKSRAAGRSLTICAMRPVIACSAAHRRLHAVIAVPEIDRVQVRDEDVILRVSVLELRRDRGLAQLSRERPLRRELQRARELLGQRAAPFDDASRPPVAPGGRDDP